ncbi:ABC transporter permease [Micromonospora sp. NPDC049523]|uniref:ABC transporter permease n=1 Tax=Micromonospora sp. NPDC049523 TaxID=3155921 RepID=UPI003432ECAA
MTTSTSAADPVGLPQAGDAPAAPRRPSRARTTMRWLPSIVLLAVILVAWQFLPGLTGTQSFIFPTLSAVIERLTTPETLQLYLSNAWVTTYEALIGLAIGLVLGVLIGFLLGTFAGARRALYPYLVALQALPKVAVAPLFVVWFGFGLAPKVLVVVMLAFFPILVNTMSGVMSIDQDKVDLFRSLVATRWQSWRQLLFPWALPGIFAGLEVAAVLALLGAIVAEFVSAREGLGIVLQQQQNTYDTAGVFAVLIILSAIGLLMNLAIRLVRRWALAWSASSQGVEL